MFAQAEKVINLDIAEYFEINIPIAVDKE